MRALKPQSVKVMYCHKTIKLVLFVSLFLLPEPAWAHYHFGWVVNEVYTNASGTNQFVELFNNCCNSQHVFATNGVSGPASIFSDDTLNEFVFPTDLPSNLTDDKYVLIGTTGFANLAGAPALDYTLPSNFFDITGDTIRFGDGFVGPVFFGTIDSITFGPRPRMGSTRSVRMAQQ